MEFITAARLADCRWRIADFVVGHVLLLEADSAKGNVRLDVLGASQVRPRNEASPMKRPSF